jgi:hypothetical protein
MLHKNPSISAIASLPIPMSDAFKVSYWDLRRKIDQNTEPNRICVDNLACYQNLQSNERVEIIKVLERYELRFDSIHQETSANLRSTIAKLLLKTAKKRHFSSRFLKTRWKLNELVDEFGCAVWGAPLKSDSATRCAKSFLRRADRDVLREVHAFLKRREWQIIDASMPPSPNQIPLYLRLPLYACSGELECSRADYSGSIRHRVTEFWNMGHDGGGQPEIRFRIAGSLPRLACSKVRTLGPASRNGGHIHLNCRADEWIGARTFFAFRYHLSWFRYLENSTRRNHRHTAVDATPRDWRGAKGIKFAAISANNWNKFGTVEVRMWGPCKNAKEWFKRAEFMKAMARWAEFAESTPADGTLLATPESLPYPGSPAGWIPAGVPGSATPHWLSRPPLIKNENSKVAWLDFARWCASAAPDVLRWVLQKFNKKARASRDQRGRMMARVYVDLFNQSDIRLARYRRPVITPQPDQSV